MMIVIQNPKLLSMPFLKLQGNRHPCTIQVTTPSVYSFPGREMRVVIMLTYLHQGSNAGRQCRAPGRQPSRHAAAAGSGRTFSTLDVHVS